MLEPIPIRVEPVETLIHADRRLAFQVVTAFGASSGSEGASTRILKDEGGRLLVEFLTETKQLFGRRKVYKTVEWVTKHEPDRIDFEGVEGPLAILRDSFTFLPDGGCAVFRYESEFAVRWWVLGWIVGIAYVRPMLRRFMVGHVKKLKETIEERARRSKVYPQVPCSHPEGHVMEEEA